ncbi:MAG: hypothetical protein AAFN79_11930 [Pseudomonadota bacterium]
MSVAEEKVAAFVERVRASYPGLTVAGHSVNTLTFALKDLLASDEALLRIDEAERPDLLRAIAAKLLVGTSP